jgi:KaiC/GvpD/RAD55 family RecA-like ATPase
MTSDATTHRPGSGTVGSARALIPHEMQHSGIEPIDGVIGGLAVGRVHVLTGAPGVGKTAACLQFAYAGLRRGEPALVLAAQRPRDLRALASHMGIDLRVPLLEERLVLLRPAPALARGSSSAAVAAALEELRAAVAALRPARVIVDPLLALLGDGTSAGAVAELAALLAAAGATTLVTLSGDVAQSHDRRLEPLLQDAAAILHLVRENRRAMRVDVVRGPAAAGDDVHRFAVAAGRGIVVAESALDRVVAEPAPRARTGTLLLLHEGDEPEAETVAALGRDHVVDARPVRSVRPAGLEQQPVDAVVVETSHRTLEGALAHVFEIARHGGRLPILTFARFNIRSADRARVLRAGADDTLAGDMSAAELSHRLELAIERGHGTTGALPPREETRARQPVDDFGWPRILDDREFTRTLAAALEGENGEGGTVIDLATDGADVDELAQLALRSIRLGAGDLAARADGTVSVFLRGARRRDTNSFVDRVRTDWTRQARGPLRVAVRHHPFGGTGIRAAVADAVRA